MDDINGDRHLASFRYRFLAEEFIDLQHKMHKPATFYILNEKDGTKERINYDRIIKGIL